MKRFLCCTLLVLIALFGRDAATKGLSWRPVAETDTEQVLIAEPDSPQRNRANRVWVIMSVLPLQENAAAADPLPYGSIKTLYEADCQGERVRNAQRIIYRGPMGTGKILPGYRYSPEMGNWLVPLPDSVEEIVLEAVCSKANAGTWRQVSL
ncbi:surface-adhesin E family protein [Cupriavidus necator]